MDQPFRKPDNAREEMPEITQFIDSLRAAFGREEISTSIRNGMADGTFWALEGEFVVGMPPESVLQTHANRLAQPELDEK